MMETTEMIEWLRNLVKCTEHPIAEGFSRVADRLEELSAENERLRMREKSMWSLEDVAGYLGVANQTVYNMIRDGRIKAYKVGREWRFRPADVEAHIALGCNIREEQDGKAG